MKNQTERRASERNYYVDGNTVRRMEAVPDYRRERREREEREREEQLRRRCEGGRSISVISTGG